MPGAGRVCLKLLILYASCLSSPLDKHATLCNNRVEYLTTLHYIQKYLSPGARVLEIGAGTGRYSHALARQGYRVDAVELVEHNIDLFRRHTLPGEPVTVTQGNALDLSFLEDERYDLTLLLGPLYHLYREEDKLRALREAIRVTRPGGILFAAYVISDGCLLDEGFHRRNIDVPEYIRSGLLDKETFRPIPSPRTCSSWCARRMWTG